MSTFFNHINRLSNSPRKLAVAETGRKASQWRAPGSHQKVSGTVHASAVFPELVKIKNKPFDGFFGPTQIERKSVSYTPGKIYFAQPQKNHLVRKNNEENRANLKNFILRKGSPKVWIVQPFSKTETGLLRILSIAISSKIDSQNCLKLDELLAGRDSWGSKHNHCRVWTDIFCRDYPEIGRLVKRETADREGLIRKLIEQVNGESGIRAGAPQSIGSNFKNFAVKPGRRDGRARAVSKAIRNDFTLIRSKKEAQRLWLQRDSKTFGSSSAPQRDRVRKPNLDAGKSGNTIARNVNRQFIRLQTGLQELLQLRMRGKRTQVLPAKIHVRIPDKVLPKSGRVAPVPKGILKTAFNAPIENAGRPEKRVRFAL